MSVDVFHRDLRAKGVGAKDWSNSFTEHEYLGGGKFAASISTGRRVFKDKADGQWKKHKLTDERPTKGYVLVQSAKCCIEVYPFYAKYFDVDHEEVRLYEERWVVQRLFKAPDTWRDVDAYSPVIAVEETENSIVVTVTYTTDYGSLVVKYIQRDGAALKHDISFKNTSGTTQTFRVLQRWAGIVGAKCNGKDFPLDVAESFLAFHRADKPQKEFTISENLWGMMFNPDGSEKIEKCLQRPIKIEAHAQGMKTDFIYAKWVLTQGESLVVDPDSSTITGAADDGYVDKYPTFYQRYGGNVLIMGGYNNAAQIYRSYIQWDTTAIIDTATITDVVFKYHSSQNQVDCHIHAIAAKPSTATDANLWADIGDGTVYYNTAGFPVVATNQQADLGANADTDLKNLLVSDWFAIGIQGNTELSVYSYIYATEYAATPKPTLYVEYDLPAAGVGMGAKPPIMELLLAGVIN